MKNFLAMFNRPKPLPEADLVFPSTPRPMHRPEDYANGGQALAIPPAGADALMSYQIGTALAQIRSDQELILRRLKEHSEGTGALNLAVGQLVAKQIEPLTRELAFVRYNAGDKLNHGVTDLEVLVGKLNQQLSVALRMQGMSAEQERQWREENGVAPEVTRGADLEMMRELRSSVGDLTTQNARLIEKLQTVTAQLEDFRKLNTQLTDELGVARSKKRKPGKAASA